MQNLKVSLVPCNWVGEFADQTIEPECNTDLGAQKDYIGEKIELQLLYNTEHLDLQKYGIEKIIKESKIIE